MFEISRMATRFRKMRTRRMKGRKGLKTRRHRGGDLASMLGMKKKAPLGSMAGPSAMPNKKQQGKNEFAYVYNLKPEEYKKIQIELGKKK
jgi:hypothetical protein